MQQKGRLRAPFFIGLGGRGLRDPDWCRSKINTCGRLGLRPSANQADTISGKAAGVVISVALEVEVARLDRAGASPAVLQTTPLIAAAGLASAADEVTGPRALIDQDRRADAGGAQWTGPSSGVMTKANTSSTERHASLGPARFWETISASEKPSAALQPVALARARRSSRSDSR